MEIHNPNLTPEGNFRLTYFPYATDAEPHTPLEEAIQFLFDCWKHGELCHSRTCKTNDQLWDVINNVLLPACEEGNQDAIHWMFVAYANGLGVEQDEDKALEYLKILAEYGYPDMQCELGKWYETVDWGTRKEEMNREAVKWFAKAAELGNVEAMYYLGECYRDGSGVDEDQKKAVEWFTKAAKQGHEEAKAELEFYNRRESEKAFEEDGFLPYSMVGLQNEDVPF